MSNIEQGIMNFEVKLSYARERTEAKVGTRFWLKNRGEK